MRNTREYPVTADEVMKIIQCQIDDLDKLKLIGDIRPYALDIVLQFIRYHQDLFDRTSIAYEQVREDIFKGKIS